jgi:hypothetical protein
LERPQVFGVEFAAIIVRDPEGAGRFAVDVKRDEQSLFESGVTGRSRTFSVSVRPFAIPRQQAKARHNF